MKSRPIPVLILAAVFSLYCFAGCGHNIVRPVQTTSPATDPANSPVVIPTTPTANPIDPDVIPSEAPNTDSGSSPSLMGSEDLKNFESALNSYSNYGFLLSSYSDVRNADLFQVFYTGAGIAEPANAEEIRAADAATSQYGEPDLDGTVLTTQQISNYLIQKTGYSLSQMNGSLGWNYVQDYDAYVFWHGDTNFVYTSCASGRQTSADTYEIDYQISGGMYDSEGNYYDGGTVTVKNSGSDMKFVSNLLY